MTHAPLIILSAGGTGGHVFPAEALAAELLRRGYRLALATDRRGDVYGGVLDGLDTYRISAGSPAGGFANKVKGAVQLGLGFFTAQRLLLRLRPAAVIGFGGYPSVPTLMAAARLRIPTAIHEQNAVLGRANRLLAPRVRAIALSHAEVRFLAAGERQRSIVTGNPVRPAVVALRDLPFSMPGLGDKLRLLVTGGSQGARVFARVLPPAIAALPSAARCRLEITQQGRPEDLEAARKAYDGTGVAVELAAFFKDLPARLGRCHLVIGRAGASTVAELTTSGRPAILVPYPHATDDHQADNARVLSRAGAGWLVPEPELTAATLTTLLSGFLADATPLANAAAAARQLGRPDAAARLADVMQRLAPANGADRPPAPPQEKAA